MNPDGVAVVTIVGVDLVTAAMLAVSAVVVARTVWPRVEGWCSRHDRRFVASLALSEDAALPQAAKDRARALFLSFLTPKQRRTWHLRRRIDVIGRSGQTYTVAAYRPFNVRTHDALFCLRVEGAIPVYDKLLVQIMLLESDEQLFLARANIRTFSRRWEPVIAAARARHPSTSVASSP